MVNITLFKKRSTWWMQYRMDGIRIRKSLSTKNKSVAKRLADEHKESLQNDTVIIATTKTKLADFWDIYYPFAKSSKRPRTVHSDKSIWHKFLKWLTSKNIQYLDQITAKVFEAYRIFLINQNICKTTINIQHRHISSIMTFAVKQDMINKNPLLTVKKFKIEQKVPFFLSQNEIDLLLKSAEEHSNEMHMVFALGIYAGFRRTEIVYSCWEWFDFENSLVLIQPQDDFIPKSHRTRPVPLNNKLREVLSKYAKPEGFLLESRIPEKERKNIVRYDFKKSFATVKRNAGVEWVTPHILRHTFASRLAKAGVSLYKIQKWLGHSDPKTTMIYAHLQAQDEEINLI